MDFSQLNAREQAQIMETLEKRNALRSRRCSGGRLDAPPGMNKATMDSDEAGPRSSSLLHSRLYFMAQPTHPLLQQIYNLKPDSPDFRDQLNTVLHGHGYEECRKALGKDDVAWFVNYLDEVLGSPDPFDHVSRKCLRELSSICGTYTVLPTSYAVPPELLKGNSAPFSCGSFGDVYLGTFEGSDVCIKRLHASQKDLETLTPMFCREAVMWKYLQHQNVLPLRGVTISPPQLISDLVLHGDLSEYIGGYPNADRVTLLSQIADGLCYLHSRDVIHGDLKGSNVLVEVVDNVPRALIADFGIAIVTKNSNSIRSDTRQPHYHPRWSAPEVLNGENPTIESDVFSFGMTMFEVFDGPPFSGKSDYKAAAEILRGNRPPRPEHPSCTDDLWALMKRCWDKDLHSRPSALEISQTLLVQ